jgi:hypothetical protein
MALWAYVLVLLDVIVYLRLTLVQETASTSIIHHRTVNFTLCIANVVCRCFVHERCYWIQAAPTFH